MIAPLRRRHRVMVTLLLIAVPVGLVLALAARPPVPVVEGLPAALAAGPGFGGGDVESYDVFGELGVAVRSYHAADGAVLELTPAEPLARPDVLVYWSGETASDRLPDGAVLLGALSDRARTYSVPAAAAGRAGHLVLYSLGHQEVVASGAVPAMGAKP